ncbi:hypothetical protein MAR_037934 [Mya arenaria]|uniref:Uncharacterized protein n=1 Tax=Mya arenaria TaxID=6604 RepID=A0ABY7FPW0_MYAAR|nr:hypothetical protein MAR_037934 [Mya arenaria]
MNKHAMHIVSASMQQLNPSQTPVIACDKPLFAKIKLLPSTQNKPCSSCLRKCSQMLIHSALFSSEANTMGESFESRMIRREAKSPQGLDHNNYAPWLPVHKQDLFLIEKQHPEVAEHFSNGAFVMNKTHHAFSGIALKIMPTNRPISF